MRQRLGESGAASSLCERSHVLNYPRPRTAHILSSPSSRFSILVVTVEGGRLGVAAAVAEVHPKLSAIDDLLLQNHLRLLRRSNIDEVGVGETTRLARAAVNGNAYVKDVLDLSEQIYSVACVSGCNIR